MTRALLVAAALVSVVAGARAQTASTVSSGPVNVQSVPGSSAGLAPFMRTGDPFLFAAGTTPQQYEIVQPAMTTSYRLVNPCAVDIRIKSVRQAETVTSTTGTRFLARTAETVSSTPNPLGMTATDRIVSVMTVSDPGAAGCTVELQCGNGG